MPAALPRTSVHDVVLDRTPHPPGGAFDESIASGGVFLDPAWVAPSWTVEPYTLNPQPSTINPQPSTLNPQPSTLNPQPSTLSPQPSTPQIQKQIERGTEEYVDDGFKPSIQTPNP